VKSAGFSDASLLVEQLKTIQLDEATHATVLEDALASFGKELISSKCKFNFDSVLTDLPTVLATARVVENIGVTAYVGAAHLIDDPVNLAAAASIATVEARHQTILNILSGAATVIPQAFDFALTPSEVLASAGPFISGCDLGIPANVPLSIANPDALLSGGKIEFKSDALNDTEASKKFSCQILSGGDPVAKAMPFDDCKIPDGFNGPVAIWITETDEPLPNDVTKRDGKGQVAGPVITFVDSQKDLLPSLIRQTDASKTSTGATTVTTVSPQEAKKIADGGSASTDKKEGDVSAEKKAGDATAEKKAPVDPEALLNKTTGETKVGGIEIQGFKKVPAKA
jgi:hypothetical protein